MKQLVEKLIRKRNPVFQFDPCLSTIMMLQFVLTQVVAIGRGQFMLLNFRRPKFMMLSGKARFRYLSKISWGRFLKLGEHVVLSGLGSDGIRLGDNVSIGAYSRLIVATSMNNMGKGIKIGNNVGMGEFAYLGGAGGLEIGNDCIIGQYFSCHPENHIYDDPHDLIRNQGVTRKGIRIGKNCWIGSKVTVLDGVEIGDGCVIAAGSVVRSSFPAGSVIGGVPAKLLKERKPEGISKGNYLKIVSA